MRMDAARAMDGDEADGEVPMGARAGSLAGLLDGQAQALGGLSRREVHGGVEYLRGGRVFAAVAGSIAFFRLRPEVARAALRTPDVDPSARGPEWVAFGPLDLDQFALDRALAWFESAWRLAAE